VPRRNLTGSWGESASKSVRLTPEDRRTLRALASRWGCSGAEAMRRALREAGQRELGAVDLEGEG
jgi:hypothetical protein